MDEHLDLESLLKQAKAWRDQGAAKYPPSLIVELVERIWALGASQPRPMVADSAGEAERGYHVAQDIVSCLKETGNYRDEEGEDTAAFEQWLNTWPWKRGTAPAPSASPAALTDEQIIREFYMHTVIDDEPLFTFDRRSALELARALLAQPAAHTVETLTDEQVAGIVHENTGPDVSYGDALRIARRLLAAQPPAAAEAKETEQSIAADCYHWIAERIGTRDGYSVQDHIDAMCNVLDECADYFHDFCGSDVGGDDEAVRIAANLRALKTGKLEDVDDAAMERAGKEGESK
ncbi:hypothetical protein [Cupriavidus pinatubonensis]|uniref:hypothetical protein n=1 Tax=Cupriavidus pinatubonensis TaxID=248026 RepID=UPI00360CDA0A